MITPKPAPVRPRVRSPETHELVLLEDLVELCAAEGKVRVIEVIGQPRSGKTTALAHLASLPIAQKLVLSDNPGAADVNSGTTDRIVVYTARERLIPGNLACELAPWSDDDLVEYLLALHPGACASVVGRFLADADRGLLEGRPELYCIAADQLALTDAATDLRSALRMAVAQRAGNDANLKEAELYSLAVLLNENTLAEEVALRLTQSGASRELFHLLSYRWIQVLLAADRIVASLKDIDSHHFPTRRLPKELVRETAKAATDVPSAIERLEQLIDDAKPESAPMAASILHLLDPAWRPDRQRCSYLRGAYLSRSKWSGLDLKGFELARADLRRCDLRGASLEGSRLARASFRESKLQDAALEGVWAIKTDFTSADLTRACLKSGGFRKAQFTQAVLEHVVATRADFRQASFQNAALASADVEGCDFRGALLTGASFDTANLRRANLAKQVLRETSLNGANLADAILSDCDLEYLELPAARFSGANFTGAWLTGTVMRGADFRTALLRDAGLADIDWEDADLRGADLRGCSFHLGSTRSGLVGSPYPCHGSRTGFYTNDYDEQSYKAPEEIRKANLCGADLRGARIDGVDFYLVDLRGATYDPQQAAHLRRCDAILFSRSP